jgi:hypothetical protein
MRLLVGLLCAALGAGLAPRPARAGDFDGSKLLICAPVEALDCAAGEACAKGTPDDVGAPAFMRIDVARKAVIGAKRTSAIHFVDRSESQLLLQGTELGYGWTIAIDQASGKMAVSLVNLEGAFVLFGSCTVP